MTIINLLAALAVKHFVADFPLQTSYMLGKFKNGLAWVLPLAAHSAVHAIFSAWILWYFVGLHVVWLAGVEFVAHFVIDRMKVIYRLPGGVWGIDVRGKYLRKYYVAFGLDQLAHQLTYVWMVWMICG